MYVQENGKAGVILSGSAGNAGYGCSFELSEVTFQSIAKLLYFKVRYEIKERLKEWKNSESLSRILSMIKNMGGWKLL